MKFYNDNLDYTGNKYNNPYALIQKAGKKKSKSRRRTNKRTKGRSKSRKTKSRK
jgi:hypothetical protein